MKLYTRKGDKGKTGILGNERLSKDDIRIEAYGTVDELNSILGMVAQDVSENLGEDIQSIQSLLFEIGTELASTELRDNIKTEDISLLEHLIDEATNQTPALTSFVIPGGSRGSSWFHIARTVCRRAERRVVTLANQVEINEFIVPYLNRLSDLFFAWARLENHTNGVNDIAWEARK